ncbi:YbhB/YbcL family Raf kinase inhibitor-like protein [Candidatus Giovannonibacteria bacterium]|nr:YbhB/YbcL family Raf kinase inhibitor-like protein [Candidatus Giovannonibacteria bacterium]
MQISSSAFGANALMQSKYTCDGDNISPPLSFSNVSANAQSLALIVDDPDARAGVWIHWVVFNIRPDTAEIPENSVPHGAVEGVTSFRTNGYGGPCPPSGTHRYFFKLYALDCKLDLDEKVSKEDVEKAMEGHIIAHAEMVGLYTRS